MKFPTSFLFLFISSSVTVNAQSIDDIVDLFQDSAKCGIDTTALYLSEPALVVKGLMWLRTLLDSVSTQSGGGVVQNVGSGAASQTVAGGVVQNVGVGGASQTVGGGAVQNVGVGGASQTVGGALRTEGVATFDDDALEAYKSECNSIDGTNWKGLQLTGLICTASGNDFMLAESNLGLCYAGDDCDVAVEGITFALLLMKGVACTVGSPAAGRIAPEEPTATNGVVVANAPEEPAGTNGVVVAIPAETTETESLASMIPSFSVATVAAAAGTVLYL
jgi:hypothetical protein